MSRLPISYLTLLALIASAVVAPPLFSREPDLDETVLAKAADYMARRALEGHIAFDTEEIKAETGVDVESIDEEVLQQAVLDRLAELRDEVPEPDAAKLAEQGNIVTLDSFEQFVAAFDEYQDVPRVVLLLSPT